MGSPVDVESRNFIPRWSERRGMCISACYDSTPSALPSPESPPMKVGLFVTCLVDLMRPSIGFAALKLLEAANYEVVVPKTQTCCGQPGWNSGDRKSARALARKLIEMEECETCCGFGGTFSIKYGEISSAMAENKCAHIQASGARAVVLGDLGCMLNIEGRLRRRGDAKTQVLHVAEVLAGPTEG